VQSLKKEYAPFTGSGSTVISTDLAETIGIVAEENDMIYRISGVGGSEFVYEPRTQYHKCDLRSSTPSRYSHKYCRRIL